MEKGENLFQNKTNISNRANKNEPKYHQKNKKNKYYYNSNVNKNHKRKDKKGMKNEMPKTPHNTGQYLSHIHQECFNKKKASQLNKDINDNDMENINFYEDNEDDNDDIDNINLDFQFIQDKERDKIMALEGKDLHDFLFKPNGDNESDNNVKMS